MASKTYTAQEMRDAANSREAWGYKDAVNNMLRQAADMMEREKTECEAIERLSLSATDGVMRYYDRHGKLIREVPK